MSEADDMAKRRAARANWPVWIGTLQDMPAEPDLTPVTSAEQRLEILKEMSSRSWALTGFEVPRYQRENLPTAIVRGSR
ncbi:MAG: hypothetical protein ACO1OB_18260 [Archangium sp.]